MDLTKSKAFADDKLDVTKNLKFVMGRVENLVGLGENARHQHIIISPQCFQKASFSELSRLKAFVDNKKKRL